MESLDHNPIFSVLSNLRVVFPSGVTSLLLFSVQVAPIFCILPVFVIFCSFYNGHPDSCIALFPDVLVGVVQPHI